MVIIYRDFNLRRFIEKAPNNDLLKHFIDENLIQEATNYSELRMRLGRILLNKSADMNLSHQTGKASKHAMRIAMFYLR